MLTQRYGNNIPLRITLATALTNRSVEVAVLRQQGRTVPFSFTTEGNNILGSILGKDQPNREDILSLRITLDRLTDRQQIIDVPNFVRLVSNSQKATLTATQQIVIITNGSTTQIMATEIPRKRKTTEVSPSGSLPTHEPMSPLATPDIILS